MITAIIHNSQLFKRSSYQYVIIMITTIIYNLKKALNCFLEKGLIYINKFFV